MNTLAKIVFVLILLGCIAVVLLAPTGLIERQLQFTEWSPGDFSTAVSRLSVIALSVSIMSIMLTVWFAWMDRKVYTSFDEAFEELRAQRLAIESIDANLGRIIAMCADCKAVLSTLEIRVNTLSAAAKASIEPRE